MTSGNMQGAPYGRDPYGFANEKHFHMASAGVEVNVQDEGVFVSCNSVSQNVGQLKPGYSIQVDSKGRFYIGSDDTSGMETFSAHFGEELVFLGKQFLQQHELVTVPVEGSVIGIINQRQQ